MDSGRDDTRTVRFKDMSHDPDLLDECYEPNPIDQTPYDPRAFNTTGRLQQQTDYEQPKSNLYIPPEHSRNKLDQLLFMRRNIVDSLNLLSHERQSLFQNQQNYYQEARRYLQEQTQTRGSGRRSNYNRADNNEGIANRYHTINDVPRIRYSQDLYKSKTIDSTLRETMLESTDPNISFTSSPSYYKATADNWLYPPSMQGRQQPNQPKRPLSRNSDVGQNNSFDSPSRLSPQPPRTRHLLEVPVPDYNCQRSDNFLERSWPRGRTMDDCAKANSDLIRYLELVEGNGAATSSRKASPTPCGNSSDVYREDANLDHQFQRPVVLLPERGQINHRLNGTRRLSSGSFRENSTSNYETTIKRRPSFRQETASQFISHISSPRRSETRDSYEENSSSLFSSEADSDFLFYPCTPMAPTPPLPALTPSLYYVSDINSPTYDNQSPCRSRDEVFNNSLDDITRQFYYDDDALSDDVFMDDSQGQVSMENDMENWLNYLNHSRGQVIEQHADSSMYANIGQLHPTGYPNEIHEAKSPSNASPEPIGGKESCICAMLKGDINEGLDENRDTFGDGEECEDLCSELSHFNINLANAFGSLRRNSTQSKSRKLWKERRTRMKKSPARQYRCLTPRFDEISTGTIDDVDEGDETSKVQPRIFTFDTETAPSEPKNEIASVKKPLRGILKNKINSPVSLLERAEEYEYCDIQGVEDIKPKSSDCEETIKDCKKSDSDNLMNHQENKMTNSLSPCNNDASRTKYVSVGVQVDLLEISASNVAVHDFNNIVSDNTCTTDSRPSVEEPECEESENPLLVSASNSDLDSIDSNIGVKMTNSDECEPQQDTIRNQSNEDLEFEVLAVQPQESVDKTNSEFAVTQSPPPELHSENEEPSISRHVTNVECTLYDHSNQRYVEPYPTTEVTAVREQESVDKSYSEFFVKSPSPELHSEQERQSPSNNVTNVECTDHSNKWCKEKYPTSEATAIQQQEYVDKSNSEFSVSQSPPPEFYNKQEEPSILKNVTNVKCIDRSNNRYEEKYPTSEIDKYNSEFSPTQSPSLEFRSGQEEPSISPISKNVTSVECTDHSNQKYMEKYPTSEVLLSKDDHEFHYLLSPTETGTTETIAVRKNSLEVYKWTRSWQRRVKNQTKRATNRSCKSENLDVSKKTNTDGSPQ